MEKEDLKYWINTGLRDDCASAEEDDLYCWTTKVISDHQASYKSAAVACALYQKRKFYERDGKKSARSYLLSIGYSTGAISHLLKFGDFIIMMQFAPHQIPPESLVRAILTDKNADRWREHYTAACRKHFAAKLAPGKTSANRGGAASRAAGVKNAEADVGTASECDDDNEGGVENSGGIVGGAKPADGEDDSAENEAEASNIDSEDPMPQNPIFDHIPTRTEIRDVLNDYRRRDPDNIYLAALGETMSRQDTFTSGALEKYKEQLHSVAILCRTVKDFKSAGGQLSDADIESINNFCAEIHAREEENLLNAINGESVADDSSDPAEEAIDDDGDEK